MRPLVADEAQKRERRKLDKFVTLNVQQISGTQQQVGPGLPWRVPLLHHGLLVHRHPLDYDLQVT